MKRTEPAVVASLERQASTQASCFRALIGFKHEAGLNVREATASSPRLVTNCHTWVKTATLLLWSRLCTRLTVAVCRPGQVVSMAILGRMPPGPSTTSVTSCELWGWPPCKLERSPHSVLSPSLQSLPLRTVTSSINDVIRSSLSSILAILRPSTTLSPASKHLPLVRAKSSVQCHFNPALVAPTINSSQRPSLGRERPSSLARARLAPPPTPNRTDSTIWRKAISCLCALALSSLSM